MVGGLKSDDALASGRQPGGLEGDFDRVAAGDGEVDPRDGNRGKTAEALGQLDARGVRRHVGEAV